MHKYLLRLYISGNSPKSRQTVRALENFCEADMGGAYELDVIDVRQNPLLAETEGVTETPTLIRYLPPPERRVVGDLSEMVAALQALVIESSEMVLAGGG